MDDFSYMTHEPPYSYWRDEITSVVISPGITRIGGEAFGAEVMGAQYENLAHVSLPKTLKSIGYYAFHGTNLTSIDLPEGLETIESSAFYYTKIKELSLPASLKKLDRWAFTHYSLENIEVAKGNKYYTASEGALYKINSDDSWELYIYPGKSSRSTITLPDKIKKIPGEAFEGNQHLQSIIVPASVTSIECGAFLGCENLVNVSLPEGLTHLDSSAFYFCTSLERLDVPSTVKSFSNPEGLITGDFIADTSVLSVYFYSDTAPEFDRYISELKGDGGKAIVYYPENATGWDAVQRQSEVAAEVERGAMEFRTWTPEIETSTAKILSVNPANGTTNVLGGRSFSGLQITFDREIAERTAGSFWAKVNQTSPGAISIYRAADDRLVYQPSPYSNSSFALDRSKTTLRISPFNCDIEPGTEYYITMGEGFVEFADGSTNPEIKKGDWVFTTSLYSNSSVSFSFASYLGTDLVYDGMEYRDDWLLEESTEYNHDLAKMSLALAMSGFGSNINSQKDVNVRNLLYDLGFDQERYVSYGYDEEDHDTVGIAMSSKWIQNSSGTQIPLLAICLRGSGYGNGGWAGNADVGGDGPYHEGFYRAALSLSNLVEKYMEKYDLDKSETRIWLTGYSRSAAVANLLSANLRISGICKSENIYTYTFATPNNQVILFEAPYYNIFNIVNPNDIVPRVPLSTWGFGKMGTTYLLPSTVEGNRRTKYYTDVFDTFNAITSWEAQYSTRADNKATLSWLLDTVGTALPNRHEFYSYLQEPLREALSGDVTALDKFLLGITTTEELTRLAKSKNYSMMALKLGQVIGDTPEYMPVRKLLSELWNVAKGAVSEHIHSKKDHPNIDIINTMVDVLENLFESDILKEHWAETYLAWMIVTKKADLTPTDQFVSKTVIYGCPVNVSVYNEEDELVAQIVDDVVQEIEGSSISTAVLGESDKVFVLPNDQNYSIRIDATDTGTMDYTILENTADGAVLRTVEFYDVALQSGDELWTNIDKLQNTSTGNYALHTEEGTVIYPDTDTIDSTTVSVTFSANGGVLEGATTLSTDINGLLSSLPTPTRSGYTFLGWYTAPEGGTKVTTSTVFTKDTTLYAHYQSSDSSSSFRFVFDFDHMKLDNLSGTMTFSIQVFMNGIFLLDIPVTLHLR